MVFSGELYYLVVEVIVSAVNDEKWMKATSTIVEEALRKMADIQKRALIKQGHCSREDWRRQLELFHGSTRGYGPNKMRG